MHELRSERLLIRPFTPDDADFVFDMYSRWEVARFLGSTPRVMTDLAEARAAVERWRSFEDPVYGMWAVTDAADGSRYGTVLLQPLPASGPEQPLQPSGDIEVGWHLHPDAWGHGYASEAARRVLEHAFGGGLPRVFAVTYAENTASQAVARRIGMTHEGTTTAYYNVACELFRIDASQ